MSYDEKANVSIDSEGNVLKCAKGLGAGECGWVKGAEICAKCGAVPVEMKMVPVSGKSLMSEEMTEDMIPEMSDEMINKPKKKKKPASAEMDPEMESMDEEDDMEMSDSEKGMGMVMGPKGRRKFKAESEDMPEEEMMDEEDDEMPSSPIAEEPDNADEYMDDEEEDDTPEEMRLEREEDEAEAEFGEDSPEAEAADRREEMAEEDDSEEPMMEDEDDEEDEENMMMGEKSFSSTDSQWEEIRLHRLSTMGIKSAEIGAAGYVCALERKAYAGSAPVCNDCPGGCVAEKGMPGILHAEGLAEKMFNGYVIDSGYSADADMFVVDVQAKDGSVKEVFIDGTSAEVMGFHKLDSSEFEIKSDSGSYRLIDFTEAAEIAVKSFDGHVVAIEPDIFEGFDSYAVEIDGFDGKSYDVFVALDGEILGYDRYDQDEAEEIEAEAAELAIKRAFSDERRMELAKEGMALPDGSYPIVNGSDLRNAIQAFGRAKDKEAAKKHIMKRARALSMESLIPENWKAASSEKSESTEGDVLGDAEFMASLVEFQLLEDQIDNI